MTTLDEVNASLKKVKIKGKDYIDVAQRVQGFLKLYPQGSIETEWLVLEPDWCVCQATVLDMGAVLAKGTAFEEKKGSINSTSYVENCETSAIGRALGFCGIGSTDAICSADELAHAMALQGPQSQPKAKKGAKATPAQQEAKARCWTFYKAWAEHKGVDAAEGFRKFLEYPDFDDTASWWSACADDFERECQKLGL